MIYTYVNAFNNVLKQWTSTGASPWLDAIDDVNRIFSSLNTAQIEEFTFEAPPAGKPRECKIGIYARASSANSTGVDVYIHDGSSWQLAGTLLWDETAYSWKNLDISSIIDLEAKLTACKLYLVKTGLAGITCHVDCARLSIIMAYTTTAKVKELLQISEATWDTEIGNCITSADGLIDSILKSRGFSVPLSPTPQNIEDASKYFAAYYFMERRAPHEESNKFYDRAHEFLSKYIEQSSTPEIPFIVATDET